MNRGYEAIERAQEVVQVYRILVHDDRVAYRDGLAAALNIVAKVLVDIGQPAAAVTPAREAITIYRELVADPPQWRHAQK